MADARHTPAYTRRPSDVGQDVAGRLPGGSGHFKAAFAHLPPASVFLVLYRDIWNMEYGMTCNMQCGNALCAARLACGYM
jgi:hypothetical protein